MTEITKELIVTSQQNEVQIAFLEDRKLVEIHHEKSSDKFSVGDIYLGKVKKIMPGLNAAFVDVGSEKDAFLHYLDLGSNVRTLNEYVKQTLTGKKVSIQNLSLEPGIDKTGKIGNIISSGQQILVQIAKEPISTKGPRITTEISLAGRYLVLVPFLDKVSISQKIKNNEERKRLKKLVQGIKPKNFGVIIRTVAENKKVDDIVSDLKQLLQKWKIAVSRLPNAVPPAKIVDELDKTSVLIRDLVNDSFNAIHVDNPALYQEIRNYIQSFSSSSEKKDIVKLYKGKEPIFEHFNVDKQIKGAFGKVVTIKNGIYLIIEQTEAMHVIDVNSGNRINAKQDQEQNALDVNMEAATEIARQLRLRDIGGIIVIDFIDMGVVANRNVLYKKLKELMASDRAKHTILPPSKFGLVQITRQRVRPATTIEILEKCPSCEGSGKVKPSILLEEELENTLQFLFQKQIESDITIAVHPYVYAYLTKGVFSKRMKWFFKYKKWIKLQSKQGYPLLQYKFFNKNMDEIVLWTSRPEKTPN